MNKQITLTQISDELANTRTSKKKFLDKIESLIPLREWKQAIRSRTDAEDISAAKSI